MAARRAKPDKQAESKQPELGPGVLPIEKLREMPAHYNPRKIEPHDYSALRLSIRTFGIVEPVVCNRRTNRIVGGHQRMYAAADEGLESMPIWWVDLDEVREKQLNIALNRISGDWDEEKLRALLKEIEEEGGDLGLTGFEDKELDRLLKSTSEGKEGEDEVPDNVPERVAFGDVWQLGKHRLVCGDATDADHLALLLDGATPTLCVTDPPYGVEYDPNWRADAAAEGKLDWAPTRVQEVENDDRADWGPVFAMSPCSVLYHWSAAGDPSIRCGMAILEAGYEIRNQIIWKKPHFPISRGHYTYQHEPCWYAVRKGRTASWIGDATASSVWEVSLDKNVEGGHSTQKPVELFRRAIANHKGDVYEPFAGSGTCVIACEELDRTCYAMEINPKYCDVVVARWEAFTNEVATRIAGADA